MPNSTHEQLDVIAVGAHPDDVEIACGGTLARLVDAGHKVGIIDLTDGEPTPLSPGPDVRLAEAKAAAETLGVHLRITLDLPNRRLFDSFEARVQAGDRVSQAPAAAGDRPGRQHADGLARPLAGDADHRRGRVLLAAHQVGRPVRAPAGPHDRPAALLHAGPAALRRADAAGGQLVVDISDTLARKMAAIRCYKTQFPPEKEHLFERVDVGGPLPGPLGRRRRGRDADQPAAGGDEGSDAMRCLSRAGGRGSCRAAS